MSVIDNLRSLWSAEEEEEEGEEEAQVIFRKVGEACSNIYWGT